MDKGVETILNGLGVAVFVVDQDQSILFRNFASAPLFGVGVRGKRLSHFVPNKRCIRAVDQVLAGGDPESVSVQLQLAVPTSFEVTISGLFAGDQLHAVVSFEDVTHVLEAEQMRSDFVANVSHELRSPLTALTGFIETLQGPAKGDVAASARFLQLMEKEAGRMARLIEDLLSLSKVQSVERFAPTETVPLYPILERVIAALGPMAQKEKAEVVLTFKDRDLQVLGNADELTQVFHNLIENAAKYSRPGSKVNVIAAVDTKEPNLVRIKVLDQGDGIEETHLGRLTERFYRVDKGRSRDKGGTGLGLAIVKHIVTRHRGRLQVDSVVGQGSTFAVLLPLA